MNSLTLSPNGVDLYALAGPPDALFLATMDGVLTLRRGSGGYRTTQHGLGGIHVGSLIYDAAGGGLFAGSHGDGLHRSLDGGQSWQRRGEEIEAQNIFTLGWDQKASPLTLFAGTEPPYLYRSRDYGESWQELSGLRDVPSRAKWNFPAPPHIAHVKHVTTDPRDSNVLYVCVEQGALLKSVDGGASFFELDFQDENYIHNKDTHRIVFDPDDPDRIYVDGGDGIAVSENAGRTWRRIADREMRVGYPDQLYVSPEPDRTLYVAGGGAPPNVWRQTGDALSTILRSRDGGRTWEQFGEGLPHSLAGNIEAVTLGHWPGGFALFAGTTDGEVFASLDRGETWSCIARGLPPISKCIHHRNLSMGRQAAAAALQSS
ncbi:MAG: hypothetical protein JWN69_2327 [Alphaproteobacteria bacterium]|nr:hypothetical protein [Alphaproteobacteria bacterium]